MFRPIALLALLLALSGCGGDNGGAGPTPPALTAAEVAGAWTFTLSDESSHCTGAAGGGNLSVRLSGSMADPNGDIINFTSDTWGGDPSTTFGQITGSIHLSTGALDLRVWKGVLVNGAKLAGTVKSDLTFSGTLQDPLPGYGAIFVFGSCTFSVTGSHD